MFEIGGPDVLTYREMLTIVARIAANDCPSSGYRC